MGDAFLGRRSANHRKCLARDADQVNAEMISQARCRAEQQGTSGDRHLASDRPAAALRRYNAPPLNQTRERAAAKSARPPCVSEIAASQVNKPIKLPPRPSSANVGSLPKNDIDPVVDFGCLSMRTRTHERHETEHVMAPSRRGFVIGLGAIAASPVLCGRLGYGEAGPFSRPLPIPPMRDAAASGNSVKLTASLGQHAFVEGKLAQTYGYSAPILGPVVRLRRGDEVEMVVENRLDAATTVHWHGLLVPGEQDGGPQQLIQPGGRWRPTLKIEQPAATLWFHPHPHGDTARQIYMGLSGMILVDDGSDARLGLPRTFGVDDLPLILQDRSFDADGSIEYDNRALGPLDIAYGVRGDVVIVNGAVAPVARVPAGLARLRLLNAANAQNFALRFSDQRTFHVIASDGGFLPAPAAVKQLTIAPAERFEVLVDFADGKSVMLETGPDEEMGIFGRLAPDGSSDYVAMMRFEPTSTTPAVKEMPARLIEPAPLNPASAVRRRQLVLNSGLCASRAETRTHANMPALVGINGKPFDMGRVDVETKLGTTEVWEITSIGMAHPFHVHGALFRVLSIEGSEPPPHLAGWKDTLLVEDKAELLVAFNQPATRAHPFMYHCHILEHEDAGLMGQYICT